MSLVPSFHRRVSGEDVLLRRGSCGVEQVNMMTKMGVLGRDVESGVESCRLECTVCVWGVWG